MVITPLLIASKSSLARQLNSSAVRMKWNSDGRVRYTEPAALSRCGSTGGTGPLAGAEQCERPAYGQAGQAGVERRCPDSVVDGGHTGTISQGAHLSAELPSVGRVVQHFGRAGIPGELGLFRS